MNNKLIFDLGCYTLDSTNKYLNDNYKVIAVDADKENIDLVNERYKNFVENQQLITINKAITLESGDLVDFYIQPNMKVWSSLNKNIAERTQSSIKTTIETTTLKDLINEFGTPWYCKIDIEGADILALISLEDSEKEKLPKIISCETECLGVGETTEGLDVVNQLYKLGYTKFLLKKQPIRTVFSIENNNEWYSFEEIVEQLVDLRRKHYFNEFFDFWYDVYATY